MQDLISRYVNGAWHNSDSSRAPPGALIPVVGATIREGRALQTGEKPGTTFRWSFIVNGVSSVAGNGDGDCQNGPLVIVAYDPSASPAAGDSFGAKPGEWAAFKNYPACLTCLGIVSAEKKLMLAKLHDVTEAYATANGSISAGSSGAISIHSGTLGSTTAISGMDPSFFNAGESVTSGNHLLVFKILGQPAFQKLCPQPA